MQQVAAEEWFLRRGMPSVTRASRQSRRLFVRAAPPLLALAVLFLCDSLLDLSLRHIDPEIYRAFNTSDTTLPRWYLIALAAATLLAIIVGIVASRWVRSRVPGDHDVWVLAIAAPLALLALPFVETALRLSNTPWADLIIHGFVIAVTLAWIRSGLGAIIVWSIRQALAQGSALTTMAARALPMIVLVTLFAFLSEGLWRVSSALSRNELWLVATILVGIASVFIWTVSRGEMRQVMEHPRCSPDELRAHGYVVDPLAEANEGPAPLSQSESVNALVILFIAQAIQVGTLVVLVFAFFCVFGAITVPASVMVVWTGHEPTTGTLMGAHLPFSHELIHTSLFLAAFSSVSFAAASATDPLYRQAFFEPILRDMRVTLAARNLYRPPAETPSQSLAQ